MADGVAEIQYAAQIALPLIGRNHFCFDPDRCRDQLIYYGRVHGEHFFGLRGEQIEETTIANDAALDHLEQTGAVLARRKSGEHVGIDQHGQWLMKAADQVLAADEVNAGLAAYRGIYLGEKRGRNLQDRYASHEDSSKETGNIGD